jgi:PAS domain S-box-containing protein
MIDNESLPQDITGLRRRAEEMVRANGASSPENLESLSPEEIQRTLQELRVHQIQLEMQNEELRRAHAELDAARERYFDLYDLAPVGYCTVSDGGLIMEANLTVAALLGQPRGDLMKRPLSRFIFPGDQDIHYQHRKKLLETGAPQAWELRLLRKDSAPFWARMEMTTAHDADGTPVSRIVVSDITEQKLKEEQKAELEAQQRLQLVGTLATGIAHDFNNLLGGVLAQAELAQAELASGAHAKKELERIREMAMRGSEIVRQLMIYAGEESEVLELIDVSEIIGEVLELLKVSVSKHAVLETNLGKDLPPVTASPSQLRRVIMNLVTNASEAIGDKDGVIRVTTSRVTVGLGWIGAASTRLTEGSYLQVEVSDTGRGMSPETQARVLDPFFTTKFAGHGLGLAVVSEIVRSLRGAIRVESSPGHGSTFRIFLPSAGQPGQITCETMSSEEDLRQFGEGAILIVEDEEALRQPSSTILRRAGYSVIEAGDGTTALELIRARQNRISVLVLDVTLPGASSREVFEEARRLRPDMKVIVTSAYNEVTAAASLAGRVENFIRKPYRLDDLLGLIRKSRPGQQG